MLGHIRGGPAVLAAQRQTLRQTQRDQNHGRGKSDGRRIRQQADDKGGETHDQDRHQEGVFAADNVADAPKDDGAERAHQKPGGEREQREDVAGRWRIGGEELRADDRGERSVEIEVVPFENGTERRGENDKTFVLRHSSCSGRCCSHCGHLGSLPENG